jgi:hypothetical protein
VMARFIESAPTRLLVQAGANQGESWPHSTVGWT